MIWLLDYAKERKVSRIRYFQETSKQSLAAGDILNAKVTIYLKKKNLCPLWFLSNSTIHTRDVLCVFLQLAHFPARFISFCRCVVKALNLDGR